MWRVRSRSHLAHSQTEYSAVISCISFFSVSFVSGNRATFHMDHIFRLPTVHVLEWWIGPYSLTYKIKTFRQSTTTSTRNGNEQISTNYVNFTGWFLFPFFKSWYKYMHWNEHETSAEYVAAGILFFRGGAIVNGLFSVILSDRMCTYIFIVVYCDSVSAIPL